MSAIAVDPSRARAVHRAALAWVNNRRAELGYSPLTRLTLSERLLEANLPEKAEPEVRVGEGGKRLFVAVAGEQLSCPLIGAVIAASSPSVVEALKQMDPDALIEPSASREPVPPREIGIAIGNERYVTKVIPGSPAAIAGVRVYDRIDRVGGARTHRDSPLAVAARINDTPGPWVNLVVKRHGRSMSIHIERGA